MLHERDVFKLLGGFIAGEVQKQLEPLRLALGDLKKNIEQSERRDLVLQGSIERIEKVLGDMPVPIDGKDGAPGKDVDMEEVEQFLEAHAAQALESLHKRVDEMFAGIPIPKDGKDGVDGKDGKDGKDGINGTNGADGESVRLDDVRDWLGALVRQTVADLPIPRHCVGGVINRAGSLLLSFSDGEFADLGKVVGADGKDCDFEKVAEQVAALFASMEKPRDGKDGRDGIGFKDMSVTFDGERAFIFKFVLEDRCEELSLTVPFMIYRGVWKQGGYERGDVVTRDGGSFVALADTLTEPGTKDCDWQLCCKRGADGKPGKAGPQGPAGPQGEPQPLNGTFQWPVKGA